MQQLLESSMTVDNQRRDQIAELLKKLGENWEAKDNLDIEPVVGQLFKKRRKSPGWKLFHARVDGNAITYFRPKRKDKPTGNLPVAFVGSKQKMSEKDINEFKENAGQGVAPFFFYVFGPYRFDRLTFRSNDDLEMWHSRLRKWQKEAMPADHHAECVAAHKELMPLLEAEGEHQEELGDAMVTYLNTDGLVKRSLDGARFQGVLQLQQEKRLSSKKAAKKAAKAAAKAAAAEGGSGAPAKAPRSLIDMGDDENPDEYTLVWQKFFFVLYENGSLMFLKKSKDSRPKGIINVFSAKVKPVNAQGKALGKNGAEQEDGAVDDLVELDEDDDDIEGGEKDDAVAAADDKAEGGKDKKSRNAGYFMISTPVHDYILKCKHDAVRDEWVRAIEDVKTHKDSAGEGIDADLEGEAAGGLYDFRNQQDAVFRFIDLGKEKTVKLKLGKSLVGRSAATDVLLDHKHVSRQHCSVLVENSRATLTDLGASHHTYVNGKKITKTALHDGDVIMVGGAKGCKVTFNVVNKSVVGKLFGKMKNKVASVTSSSGSPDR